MKNTNKEEKKGFTLVELLVVIAILAILASVSVIGYLGFSSNARDSKALTELTEYKTTAIGKLVDGHEEVTLYLEGEENSKVLCLAQNEEANLEELKVNFVFDDNNLTFTPVENASLAEGEIDKLDEFAVAALFELDDASSLTVVKKDSDVTMGTVDQVIYDPYNNDKNTATWTILTGDVINAK